MISKKVRQIMAASMAVVMTVGLAACEKTDETVKTTPSAAPTKAADKQEEKQPEVDPKNPNGYEVRTKADGSKIDLGGALIEIRDWWSSSDPAEPTDAFGIAQKEYLDWAQDYYNFTIKRVSIGDWGSNPTDLVDYCTMGGDEHNYLFVLRPDGAIVNAMNTDLLYDVATLTDAINFTEDKWQMTKIHQLYSKNGGKEIYAFAAGDNEPRPVLYFNKKLVEEAGIKVDDLYKIQSDPKAWTWDAWKGYLDKVQKDKDNDGQIDVWGMACNTGEVYTTFVYSNGGAYVIKDANGNLQYNLEAPETIDALTYAFNLFQQYHQPQPEGANWDWFYGTFCSGQDAFHPGSAYEGGQNLKPNMDDPSVLGCMTFPVGPSAGGKFITWGDDNMMVIPACYSADKAWKIAFAYDIYTDEIPGFEGQENWKNQYYSVFEDLEVTDVTMKISKEASTVQYHTVVAGIEIGPDLLWTDLSSVAKSAEAIREKWKAAIDEANK